MPSINIDKLAFGGSGFGRIDGKACFVPYTAPGDVAEISISKDNRSYSEGVLEKLLISSALRVHPICPVFGSCGGCNWQHISYDEQCLQKDQIFADTLWRSARVDASRIKPVLRSASPFNYRQRVQLKVSFSEGKLSLGFYRTASHQVVDLPGRCDIAASVLNNSLAEVRELLTSFGEAHKIEQVDLVSSADGQVSLLFHCAGAVADELSHYLADSQNKLRTIHGIAIKAGRRSSIRHIFGEERICYPVPDSNGGEMDLYFSPDGFSQVNLSQNRAIIKVIIDFCSASVPGTILDLFCGNGNFSLPLAKTARRIVGFESFDKSVSLAKHNALTNGIHHANYICRDSAEGVNMLADTGEVFDLVIVDPPRAGADILAGKLHKVAASYLIYISCDPPTLSRDLAKLQQSGFEVMSIQPVDMFPQTYHLESITFLKKSTI
jgi:23S rRNA (uracil1939-C5)-methyltransferase